ncbi:unnamed protein product [Ixodes pacificus]
MVGERKKAHYSSVYKGSTKKAPLKGTVQTYQVPLQPPKAARSLVLLSAMLELRFLLKSSVSNASVFCC